MGLFNRFRKNKEESREDLIRSFEPRKLEKLNNIMFERHESIQSSYLKTLSEDELRTFLKIMDKSFVIPRGFAGSDFSDTKTSLSSDFPDFRRLVEKTMKEREAEDKFIPLGSLLKDKSGSFPRRKKTENNKKGNTFDFVKKFFDRQAKEADYEGYGRGNEFSKRKENAEQIGKELKNQGHVVFEKQIKRYYQTDDNCFELACYLADKYGYEHPKTRKELTDIIFDSKGRQLGWGSQTQSFYDKPSEACFVIRSPDNVNQVHVTFELFGKEFNYGPGTKQKFPIERRIFLRKKGDNKILTKEESSYIKYMSDLRTKRKDVLEQSGNFLKNAAKEAGYEDYGRGNELTKEEEEQFKREEERDIEAATAELNKEYEQFEKEDEKELENAIGDVEAEQLEEDQEEQLGEEELEETLDD
ncbi:MAG: hypothetical protein V1818_04430 [Candidatus Aenigmatarchaeota archaeon]